MEMAARTHAGPQGFVERSRVNRAASDHGLVYSTKVPVGGMVRKDGVKRAVRRRLRRRAKEKGSDALYWSLPAAITSTPIPSSNDYCTK